jgi:hypothetical protein
MTTGDWIEKGLVDPTQIDRRFEHAADRVPPDQGRRFGDLRVLQRCWAEEPVSTAPLDLSAICCCLHLRQFCSGHSLHRAFAFREGR